MSTTVLIIEDEPMIALEIQETLKKNGFHCPEVATAVEEIFDKFRRVQPDVILMDINLRSYTDGVDAAHRLSLFGSTPVIFLTANEDPFIEKRAKAIQNSHYVRKPFDESELVDLINRVARR
mgnify:CR=1 FL=1